MERAIFGDKLQDHDLLEGRFKIKKANLIRRRTKQLEQLLDSIKDDIKKSISTFQSKEEQINYLIDKLLNLQCEETIRKIKNIERHRGKFLEV